VIAIAAAASPANPSPGQAFEGRLPDPVVAGLYRYDDHVDAPSIGPAPSKRSAPTEAFENTAAMARWIASTSHSRPFWRDRGFVAEFGRATRAELRAAVDELWRRAGDAARVARMPIAWPANLPNHHDERTFT
jgi:hypothetical protein